MLAHYKIEFFGGLKVYSGVDQAIVRFRSQKTAALLAYLAYYRDQSHSREKLADLFWGKDDVDNPSAARASLSVALSSLRKQLEPPGVPRGSVLICDPARIGLASHVETDAALIETLLDRARCAALPRDAADFREKSLRLCQADFLPEMYGDWVQKAQAQMTERKALVLGQLADYYLAAGDCGSAAEFARTSLALNPDGPSLSREVKELARSAEQALPREPVRVAITPSFPPSAPAPAPKFAALELAPSTPTLLLPLNRFFGRDRERQRILSLLAESDTRLVTLTGPGGVGKSRVALMVAQDAQAAQREMRICFAPFTDVATPEQMRYVLWRALQLPPGDNAADTGSAADDALVEALRRSHGPTLLLIDGAEQVADLLGDLLAFVLPRVPNLTCLVTSRQRLLQDGEREVAIGPLPVPPASVFSPDQGEWNIDALRENWPSLALFADRARETLSYFSLTPANIVAVTTLVRRLEGIPLSLELAAARVQAFTPAQILAHLDQRFDILQHRRKRTSAAQESGFSRHLSLRETIAWSFDLLPSALRSVMCRLSVFRGGWTVEAAAAVLPPDVFEGTRGDNPSRHLLATGEALEQLCDASLLRVMHGGEEGRRFLVLDTIREFADAVMEAAEREATRYAHAHYFLRLAEEAEPHLVSAERDIWLARLAAEHENVLAALDRSVDSSESEYARSGMRIASAMHRYWLVRGHLRTGRRYLQRFLNHAQAATWEASERATARNRAGILAMTQGDSEAARADYLETLELHRALNDQRGIATTLNNLAILANGQHQYEQARQWNEESLTLWRALGDQKHAAIVLANLGGIANDMGQLVAAQTYLIESIEINMALKNTRAAAISTLNLGENAFKHGNLKRAKDAYLSSLRLFQPTQDVQGCAYALLALGVLAQESGQARRAQRLIETATTAYRAFGIPLPDFLAEKIESAASAPPEMQSASALQEADTEVSVLALRLLTQIALDDWEETDVRQADEPVRLRIVG